MEDISVEDKLIKGQFDMNFSHFYENFFGGEYGSSIDKISARGVGICEKGFPSLEENFTLTNMYHKDILDKNY